MLQTHDRYSYSNITRRPDYAWPGGKRLAVYVALNIEQFRYGIGNRVRIWFTAQNIQYPGLQVGQTEMRQKPTTVTGLPRLGEAAHHLMFPTHHRAEHTVRVR